MAKGDAAYLFFDDGLLRFECVTSEMAEHRAEPTTHVVEGGADVTDHVHQQPDRVTLEVFVSNSMLEDIYGYGGAQQGEELSVPTMTTKTVFNELDVPEPPGAIPFTPGAAMNAAFGALSSLLSGKPSYKAQGLETSEGPDKTYGAQVMKWPAKYSAVKDVVSQLDDWKRRAVRGEVFTAWATYKDCIITKVTPRRTAQTGDACEISIELQSIRLVESKLTTAPAPTEPRGKNIVAKGKQPTDPVPEPATKKKEAMKSAAKAGADRVRR